MKTPIRQLAALALLFVAGCSADVPSAPATIAAPSSGSADLLGTVGTVTSALGLTPAVGLLRTTPLAAPVTVSQLIGTRGGTLSIPETGVTVTVPAGALASATRITMTARAGSLVAYDFAPHGITFAKPLTFSQSLSGTNATLLSAPLLKLAYYTDDGLLGPVGGLVSELIGGVVNLVSWTFTAKIQHFSGYMVSCGRDLGM